VEHSRRASSRWLGWWDFALEALDGLTAPKADTSACDRAVEQLARASWVGSLVDRPSVTIRRAWSDSQSHAWASWLARELAPAPPAATLRVAGWLIAVVGATALGLDAIKPMPIGPLSWVVPSGLVAAGLLLMAAAGPVARASADRRLRHKVS
jgi:hypothetical protein